MPEFTLTVEEANTLYTELSRALVWQDNPEWLEEKLSSFLVEHSPAWKD